MPPSIADAARRPGVVREEASEVSYVGLEGRRLTAYRTSALRQAATLRRPRLLAADQFLREVDSLRKEILSQRESRKRAQPRSTNTPIRARVVLETGIASTTESTNGVGITRVSFKPARPNNSANSSWERSRPSSSTSSGGQPFCSSEAHFPVGLLRR
jgi:hypothetical protein